MERKEHTHTHTPKKPQTPNSSLTGSRNCRFTNQSPSNISVTEKRQSYLGTKCPTAFLKFYVNEKIGVNFLQLTRPQHFLRGAGSCRVDWSPITRVFLLLFICIISFRNHPRSPEVHGSPVKYFLRHKYMLHSLENLVQPGRQPESVFRLFFDWHDLTASLLFIYMRYSCDRMGRIYTEMLSICSALPHHLYHAGTVPCRKHWSLSICILG